MQYINKKFSDGYNIGTSFTEIILDYHGDKAIENALFWERQYGELTYHNDHILCTYVNCENTIHLSVWLDDERKPVFSVSLFICDIFDDSSEFSTIEEAIEDYKTTVDRCLNNEFGKIAS